MDFQVWWDTRAARRDRVQALRMVGISPKLAPLPWEKLTETARAWLTQFLLDGYVGNESPKPPNSTACNEGRALPSSSTTQGITDPVREWWDNQATAGDQAIVLARVELNTGFAGMPWAFLPTYVRDMLARQLRISWPK